MIEGCLKERLWALPLHGLLAERRERWRLWGYGGVTCMVDSSYMTYNAYVSRYPMNTVSRNRGCMVGTSTYARYNAYTSIYPSNTVSLWRERLRGARRIDDLQGSSVRRQELFRLCEHRHSAVGCHWDATLCGSRSEGFPAFRLCVGLACRRRGRCCLVWEPNSYRAYLPTRVNQHPGVTFAKGSFKENRRPVRVFNLHAARRHAQPIRRLK